MNKFNKKAEVGESMFNNIIYIVLVLLVFSLNYASLSLHKNGTAVWQEYYATEITKALELAKPGDQIILNVQKGVEIAGKNSFSDLNNMFTFNSVSREVCSNLGKSGKTCYYYFNNVEVNNSMVDVTSDQSLLIINIKS